MAGLGSFSPNLASPSSWQMSGYFLIPLAGEWQAGWLSTFQWAKDSVFIPRPNLKADGVLSVFFLPVHCWPCGHRD